MQLDVFIRVLLHWQICGQKQQVRNLANFPYGTTLATISTFPVFDLVGCLLFGEPSTFLLATDPDFHCGFSFCPHM
jgi:hypothetical protein